MNRFLKTNLPWLSLLGLALVIVLLAFIFRPKSPDYQISAGETLKLMNDQSMQIAVKDIAGKQLIDIRSTEMFSQGHPESAINIPIRQLLDEESVELFDNLLENGKEAILYGSDQLQATAPLFLLQQLGYKNLKLLKGGLTSFNEFKEPEIASSEVSVVDTAFIRLKPELNKVAVTKAVTKTRETVIPSRKAASSGGGC